MRGFLGRLKRWLVMRWIFTLARWARNEGGHMGNRTWWVIHLARLELRVEYRRVAEEEILTREEVMVMLDKVRAQERRMGWRAPDSGPPKDGQLIYDGEPVPVLYWGPFPGLEDGPEIGLAERARVVVSVDAEGTSRVLKDSGMGATRRV